jgi:gliding motility associated protien GldN
MKNSIKFLVSFVCVIVLAFNNYAQGTGVSVNNLPYEEIHVGVDRPVPYQYVREADVMWSRIIWRRIELSEKMNHILALPEQPNRGSMSLIDVLLDGIHTKGLTAYKAKASDAGNEFNLIMTEDDVHKEMGASKVVSTDPNNPGEMDIPYNSAEINSYIVKELWYFDKQRSVLEVRIIGMCPIRKYYRPDDINYERPLYKKVFWVNYLEARPLLAKSPIYSPYTDVKNLTYDDIFQKRLFSSYIFMESNPYNRAIIQYESGLEVLLEADRVKNEIFNFEQDLWSY